jgi:hypothetical protein
MAGDAGRMTHSARVIPAGRVMPGARVIPAARVIPDAWSSTRLRDRLIERLRRAIGDAEASGDQVARARRRYRQPLGLEPVLPKGAGQCGRSTRLGIAGRVVAVDLHLSPIALERRRIGHPLM